MSGMQCEICGADIPGASTRITIDGSALEVCKSCARFGKQEDKFSPVPRKIVPAERAFRPVRKPKPRDSFQDLKEVVPEYGHKIKEARDSLGLSLELADRLKEKASLLRKIEREELVPEDEIRKKLEKELKIKLIEEGGAERWKPGAGTRGLTLGDIASIKKR